MKQETYIPNFKFTENCATCSITKQIQLHTKLADIFYEPLSVKVVGANVCKTCQEQWRRVSIISSPGALQRAGVEIPPIAEYFVGLTMIVSLEDGKYVGRYRHVDN